jgi:hypothetical protein
MPGARRVTRTSAAEIKQKYGITDAQWDLIPDIPER